jgi:hypothetical protein
MIRSPLAVVEMYASFLLDDPGAPGAKDREFCVIKTRALMLNLINDLLTSPIESGDLT